MTFSISRVRHTGARMAAPLLALALAASLAACTGSGPHRAGTSDGSYASWTGAMQDSTQVRAGTPAPAVEVFNDQSIRQVVRLSLGGDRIRVKVSNLFGKAPVTFSGVQVAPSTGGAGIDAARSRVVQFAGQPSVTLAAGEERLSDPVALPVQALGDVAVTMYFAQPTTVTTLHTLGRQTAYIAQGQQLAAANLVADKAAQRQSYYGLTAVQVASSDAPRVVVAFGDSITDGYNATVDGAKRYPNQLDERLKASGAARTSVVNAGISGNRWLRDVTGPNGNGRFERDVLRVPGVTHTIILLGINDLRSAFRAPAEAASADNLKGAISTAVQKAKAQNIKVLLGTILPCKGEAFCPASVDAQRQLLNTWIRSNPDVDGVVDFDKVTHNPADPAAILPAYNSGDHLHPNDAGYQAMAEAVDLAKLR